MLELYAIAGGKVEPGPGDPTVVICMDEFGPLNLQPHPGRQWAPTTVGKGDPARPRRRRRRATYLRPNGIRHLLAGYDLATDRLYGHIKVRKTRTEFLAFCRYLRSLHPAQVRIAIVLDNFSPHLSTITDSRVGTGLRRTTSSWPTCRSSDSGSTGSRPSSPPCATSLSTAPTTPAIASRPA